MEDDMDRISAVFWWAVATLATAVAFYVLGTV